jgi:hypothetical protein
MMTSKAVFYNILTGAFQNYAATPLFWRGQGEVIINA